MIFSFSTNLNFAIVFVSLSLSLVLSLFLSLALSLSLSLFYFLCIYVYLCIATIHTQAHWAPVIKAATADLYTKRWGNVIHFICTLCGVLGCLRDSFVAATYKAGAVADDAEGHDASSSFDPVRAEHVLHDDGFLMYLRMTMALHKGVKALTGWFEGCACHSHILRTAKGGVSRKRLASRFRRFGDCPVKGKRAAELAAGEVSSVCREIMNTHFGSFMDRHIIMIYFL